MSLQPFSCHIWDLILEDYNTTIRLGHGVSNHHVDDPRSDSPKRMDEFDAFKNFGFHKIPCHINDKQIRTHSNVYGIATLISSVASVPHAEVNCWWFVQHVRWNLRHHPRFLGTFLTFPCIQAACGKGHHHLVERRFQVPLKPTLVYKRDVSSRLPLVSKSV